MDNQETNKQIAQLRKDLEALSSEFYSNNFSARQDFNKFSDFRFRLKVPHYASLPTTCVVGEIAEQGGKLNICSSADTWTVVGTQS